LLQIANTPTQVAARLAGDHRYEIIPGDLRLYRAAADLKVCISSQKRLSDEQVAWQSCSSLLENNKKPRACARGLEQLGGQ
jgi:hypothetical protein